MTKTQKKRRSTAEAMIAGFLYLNDSLDGYDPKVIASAMLEVLVKNPQRLTFRPAFDVGLDLADDVETALQKYPRYRPMEPEPGPEPRSLAKGFKRIAKE